MTPLSQRGKSDSAEPPTCKCEHRENEYISRSDPEWWSCMDCEGRVAKLTEAEKRERGWS